MIETKDLTHRYEGGKVNSLNAVSIEIRKHTKTVILGGNGAGKSTLFYHFNGVFKPKSGTVLYESKEISYGRKELTKLRSEISVVLQNPDDQIFSATVEEDIAFGPLNLGLPRDEVARRVDAALFQTGLTALRTRPTSQLSYGQRKRVAFAGAMAMEPKVLIMDEPTAGLDPQMSRELMEVAEQLHLAGTTVILSTHDVDLAYRWAEDVHVLRAGKLVYSGSPEGFFADRAGVHLCGLTQPVLYTLNESHFGDSPSPYPRDAVEFASKIRQTGPDIGTLHLVWIDETADSAGSLDHTYDEEMRVGVYGIGARREAYDAKAKVDFAFNAIEACLFECLAGKSAVLLADASMAPYILERVARLEEFGTKVPIVECGKR